MARPLRFIDLFCGMGSFHYSFRQMGWKCVMACDIDKSVQQTYMSNYNIMPCGDISDILPENVPEYDVLCAGFPCQPFSQCGQHRGFNDDRGNMFFQVMRFVCHHFPKLIVLENVPGLLTHEHGNTFKIIKRCIEENNYVVRHKVLRCSDYGLPQMRKRLFIVAVHKTCKMVDVIDDLLNMESFQNHVTLSEFFKKPFEKDTAYTIRCGGRNSPLTDKHNWDGYIVGNQEYRLTIEDCLRLQGFEDFHLSGTVKDKWKQLGNTIPTVFTSMIGQRINAYISLL